MPHNPKRINASIEFVPLAEDWEPYQGPVEILERPGEMILDADDAHLVGRQPPGRTYYTAEDHGNGWRVIARWANVGDLWVGYWLEMETDQRSVEWLFVLRN